MGEIALEHELDELEQRAHPGPPPQQPDSLDTIRNSSADHKFSHKNWIRLSIKEIFTPKAKKSGGQVRRQKGKAKATTILVQSGEDEFNANALPSANLKLKSPKENGALTNGQSSKTHINGALTNGQSSSRSQINGDTHAKPNIATETPKEIRTEPQAALAIQEQDPILQAGDISNHPTTAIIAERRNLRKSKIQQVGTRILPFVQVEEHCWIRMDLKMIESLDARMEVVIDGFRDTFKEMGLAHVNYSLQLVWSGKTADEEDMEPTIMFTCAKKDMNDINRIAHNSTYIEDGCKLKIVEAPPKKFSGGVGFPLAPNDRPPMLVEACLAGAGNLCGVKARACIEGSRYTETFTLGGLILINDCCYALTTGHALTRTIITVTSLSDVAEFQPLGEVYACEPSGSYYPGLLQTESATKYDWALVEVPKALWAENIFTLPYSNDDSAVDEGEELSMPTPIVGYLNSSELLCGDVWVVTKSGKPHRGILNPTIAFVSIDGSGIYVRAILLDGPLADGHSGSWVIRDNKLCGYIYGGLAEKPWAYMIPIETVFDRISSVLIGKPKIELPSQEVIAKILSRAPTDTAEPDWRRAPSTEELSDTRYSTETAAVADSRRPSSETATETIRPANLEMSNSASESFEDRYESVYVHPYRKIPFTEIETPPYILTMFQKRKYIREVIDNSGFNWMLWQVAASTILAESYNLSATNVILPSLAYLYWPDQDTWRETLVICMTLAGSIVGQLLFGFYADRFGRKQVYGMTSGIILLSTILFAAASPAVGSQLSWTSAMRFITGIGIGGLRIVSAVTCTEWASTKFRPRQMAAVFLMQPLAQLISQLIGLAVLRGYNNNYNLQDCTDPQICGPYINAIWRLAIGLGALPAALAVFYSFLIKESPSYVLEVKDQRKRPVRSVREALTEMVESRSNGLDSERVEPSLPAQFSRDSLYDYFVIQGNWRFVSGTFCCWFLLNYVSTIYGLGLGGSRPLAKLWAYYPSNATLSAVPSWNSDPAQPNATIYQVLNNNALQSIYTISIGSVVGTVLLIISINYLPRKNLLTWSFLWLTVVWVVAGACFLSLFKTSAHGITIGVVAIAQFSFNFGPSALMFMIPAEIFPTRYRCTCYAIAATGGSLGSIILTVSLSDNAFKPNSNGLGYIFIVFAAVMATAAIFSWAWIPDLQNPRAEGDGKELNNKTLEELGEGLQRAKQDGQVIGFRKRALQVRRKLKLRRDPRLYEDRSIVELE